MPSFAGTISSGREIDSYDVFLYSGVTYYIEAEGRATSAGSLRDPFLEIFQNGAYVGYDDDGGYGLNARYVFTPLVSDTYTFEISSAVVATGSYRLSVYEDDYRGTVEGVGARGIVGNTRDGLTAEIDYLGDRDIFSTQLISGLTYTFSQRGRATDHGTLAEPALRLLNGEDRQLAYSDFVNGRLNASIVYQARGTGPYFLQAGAYDDAFTGTYRIDVSAGRATAGADVVNGTAFNDAISGLQGADNIRGGDGADRLYGVQHGDILRGQAGADLLNGGLGADILIGGAQADTFVYGTPLESTPTSMDVIRAGDGAVAFELPGRAGGDRIDLSVIDANVLRAGNQAFVFGSLGAGGLSLAESGSATIVRGNLDRDAAFEFAIRIEDGAVRSHAYGAGDFLL